jgi:hypothetical protein
VSDQAIACPSCGAAPPKRVTKKKSRALLYAMIGAPLILFAWIFAFPPDSSDPGLVRARDAIDFCWKDQKAKSADPDMARFVAGTCEMLERDFQEKYGRNP